MLVIRQCLIGSIGVNNEGTQILVYKSKRQTIRLVLEGSHLLSIGAQHITDSKMKSHWDQQLEESAQGLENSFSEWLTRRLYKGIACRPEAVTSKSDP